jgi:t-SNARE complex subunit (syntaxin)
MCISKRAHSPMRPVKLQCLEIIIAVVVVVVVVVVVAVTLSLYAEYSHLYT